MYDRTSAHVSINDARPDIFFRGNQQIDYIPPTKAALVQHIKRAMLQPHVWHCCLVSISTSYSPLEHGWQVGDENALAPFWTDLPQAAEACYEFIKCVSKKTMPWKLQMFLVITSLYCNV